MEYVLEREPVKTVLYSEDEARAKFDRVAGYYFWIMGFMEIKVNLQAITVAAIKPGEQVLDACFGTGWCLERLIPYTGNGQPVQAVDFSAGMKAEALKNLRRKNLENRAVLQTANVKKMPYEDACFDVVFASFVIDLMNKDDRDKTLKEFKRVLKPDGRLVLVSMTKKGRGIFRIARFFYEFMYHKWLTILGYRPSCRPIYVENEVMKAGFRIQRYRFSWITGFFFPIAIISAKK